MNRKSFETNISMIAAIYFMLGLLFAFGFALYYRWPLSGYLSPGFFAVIFTWPLQIGGMIADLQYYGLAGKPI